ncbi:serine hydrolase domain-containing protein [Paludibacterium yongneupense]|uniref:serine hydrolase domain-containing protein n=1 Tax=Paludibacterium yongneupense TaxID=400061 RepID=UPI001B7FBD0F|nr:serine hydrolase domain-containing protein [Paludibacterium yongneupense]
MEGLASRCVCWRALRLITALGLLLALGACSTLSETTIDSTETEVSHYQRGGNLHDEVDSLVQPLIRSGQTPGMMVGVLLPDGSAHFYGYGTADKARPEAPQADTQFAVGSLSKCFLAVLTAQLVAEGRLSWDETLPSLLPPGTPLSADARKITLLQLLTHTSGLPRQPMTLETLDYFVRYLFTGESFYRHFTRQYMLDYLKDFRAPAPAHPIYSNVGYGLVGYALELRTGQTLDALLAHYISGPLQLAHTGYEAAALPGYATRARGYAGDQPKFIARGQPVPDWEFTDLMKGSAAIHSSARDLLHLAAAFLHPGVGPRGQALQELLRLHYPRQGQQAWIAWDHDTLGGADFSSMIGLVAGYTAYMGLDIEHHSAVVVLQNSFNWADEVGHRLLARIARANPTATDLAHRSGRPPTLAAGTL